MNLPDFDSDQKVFKLQNSAYVVRTKAGDILVNSPPEILKSLLAHDFNVPKIILIPPDARLGEQLGSSGFVHQGINYASVEFMLFINYFVFGGQRTHLITATTQQAQRLHKILQETIVGPQEISAYYPYPWVERECRAVSYIASIDRALEVYDLVEISALDIGGGVLENGVKILHVDNQYIFTEDDNEIATLPTIIDEAAVPLTIEPPQPVLRQEITIQFIGSSDGFDPDGTTTCFLAYFGESGRDQATLFDVAAYIRIRLGNLGISPAQISEVFISHIHEDHIAGLPELLLSSQRIRVITSDTIYHSLLRLLSAMLNVPEDEVAALFDFFPLQPGHPLLIDGKQFEAIYGIHTIPTIAVKVNGLCYSGDMRYDEVWFDELVGQGVLSEVRRNEIVKFADGTSILVQDAGGGTVHTTPTPAVLESLQAKSKHVILTHRPRGKHLPTGPLTEWSNVEFAADGYVASIGEILELDPKVEKLETISACPLYSRLSISRRMALTEQVEMEYWNPGEIIINEGDSSDGRAYIVHKGLVKTLVGDKMVQVLGRGHSIGERGALTYEHRVASIVAYGQTQMLVLYPHIFDGVARYLGLKDAYKRVEWLWNHPIFGHLPWATLLDLALDFQPLHLPVGRLLFEYGKPGNECYLLISGEIALLDKNLKPVFTFDSSGEFFGGRAVLFGTHRNTYACVSKKSEIWALPAAALQRLQKLYPSVMLHLRSVEMKRQGRGQFISALNRSL